MKRRGVFVVISWMLFMVMCGVVSIPSGEANPKFEVQNSTLEKQEFIQKTRKLQIPFIANNGQTDELVKFYANTFGGTVFVTKDGEIVYSLPGSKSEGLTEGARDRGQEVEVQKSDVRAEKTDLLMENSNSKIQNPKSEARGVSIKEELVGGKVSEIHGEKKSETSVNYFRGKDPSKWKTGVSTYETVNLGEIYEGIELKLRAYGNNVEKLFSVKPDVDTDVIRLRLSGGKELKVNGNGALEIETELGSVKFTKPVAYQEIDGKRVEVGVEYNIQKSEARNKKPQFRSQKSELINPKSKIPNPKSEYGFKVASYDKTKELIIDPLLASTYLGGSGWDLINWGRNISIDSGGNIYITGTTQSSDFPTTSGAYDTSYSLSDAFVSKLNSDLTTLPGIHISGRVWW